MAIALIFFLLTFVSFLIFLLLSANVGRYEVPAKRKS